MAYIFIVARLCCSAIDSGTTIAIWRVALYTRRMRDFLDALFDREETICVAGSPYGTSAVPAAGAHILPGALFFSINPLHTARADMNVTAYRNFLIELDGMGLDEQMHYVEELEMPWTSCVYSGGKSLHFIIALEESLPDEQTYRRLAAHLHTAVERADHSTKNPSRLSRLPGVVRPDTGKEQRLIRLNERIELDDFQAWLSRFPAPPEFKPRKGRWSKVEPIYEKTKRLLMYGPGQQDGGRYRRIMEASVNLCAAGWSVEQVVEAMLKPVGPSYDVSRETLREIVEGAFEWKVRQDELRVGKAGDVYGRNGI